MPRIQAKPFSDPDELRATPNVRFKIVGLDEETVGHCSFQPGWRWSTEFGVQLGLASCPIRHLGYSMSGTVRVQMDDGEVLDIGPDTVFGIPPGHDHWVLGDEPWVAIEWGASGRALAEALREPAQRSLATVLFSDIVDSTARLDELGDSAWRELLGLHNARVRDRLNVFRGREVKTTGDGFLAVFDSATRAARCALAMTAAVRDLGVEIRVGLHTGEVETIGQDVRGIAVHVAARLLAVAGPSEVVVSSTTRELLEGSMLSLEDMGSHELKGLSGERRLYRLLD